MRTFVTALRELLVQMAGDARELRLSQTASSLTVLTLMAIVPVVAIGLMVLTALPAFATLRAGLEEFISSSVFLPSISSTVMETLNRFVAAAQRLSALGTVIFMGTAIGSMLTIDRTLNQIWGTERPRPLWQRLMLYWAMLSLGPLLLGGALALQLKVRSSFRDLPWITEVMASLSPSIVIAGVLFVLYKLAPNTRVRSRHALAGAVLAALLLEGMRVALSLYVRLTPGTTMVYGAFAALPIFLTWLFAAWLSVLLGASLAARLPGWGRAHPTLSQSAAQRYETHVQVLERVLAQGGDGGLRASACGDLVSGDARLAQQVARRLSDQGYLLRVWPVHLVSGTAAPIWQERWLPAPGWRQLTLRPLFQSFWGTTHHPAHDPGAGQLDQPLDRLWRQQP
ncbi:MAG: YihY family inner membrane protein [Burkholderiaceae bacterium]